MAKTAHVVKLHAVKHDGTSVNSNNWHERIGFTSDDDYFKIYDITPVDLKITTPKGTYTFRRDLTSGIYRSKINGVKIHVSLQKMVGKLTYWA